MMYTVFAHAVFCSYRAPLFSKATVFYVLASALTFIPPLLIAYRSQGFWLRQEVYREQPDVHFQHDLIVSAETGAGDVVGWSSFQGYNDFLKAAKTFRVPLIKSSEADENRDGRKDELSLKVELPLQPSESITALRMHLFFDVRLYRFSSVHLSGMAVVELQKCSSRGGGGGGVDVVADLMLVQKQPVAARGRDNRYLEPIIDPDGVFAEDFDLVKLTKEYQARNLTTRLENSYVTWTQGSASSLPNTFVAEVTIRYPEQTITYRPGFWQMMKWGWVQYVSVLIVFVFVFRQIKTYIFSRQVLPTQPCVARVKPHAY